MSSPPPLPPLLPTERDTEDLPLASFNSSLGLHPRRRCSRAHQCFFFFSSSHLDFFSPHYPSASRHRYSPLDNCLRSCASGDPPVCPPDVSAAFFPRPNNPHPKKKNTPAPSFLPRSFFESSICYSAFLPSPAVSPFDVFGNSQLCSIFLS